MTVLNMHNVKLQYRDKTVFNGLELHVEQGEVVAVRTGVLDGGSSLLKMAAGIQPPTSGDILLNGRNIAKMDEQDKFESACYCFEEGGLLSIFTNYNNIAFPLLYHTTQSNQEISDHVLRLARKLNVDELLFLEPHQLNDVQTRIFNVLRALAFEPSLILMDEIQSGMSMEMREQLLNAIFGLCKQQNISVVMTVTAGDDERFANRVYEICDKSLKECA